MEPTEENLKIVATYLQNSLETKNEVRMEGKKKKVFLFQQNV